MQIIPAIDLKDGRCVRLTQGRKADATVYDENPVGTGRYRLHMCHSVTADDQTVNHFLASQLLHSCCDGSSFTVARVNRER